MTTGGSAAAAEPAAAASEPAAAAPAAESSPLGEPVTIDVPSMGESITEGTIAAFLKGPGDYVEMDEVIAQIETDKVSTRVDVVTRCDVVSQCVPRSQLMCRHLSPELLVNSLQKRMTMWKWVVLCSP